MNQLYCQIRKEYVAALPEEIVRQQLLIQMIEGLGYPKGVLAVEKALRQFPHLASSRQSLPDRRVDIVCFAKGIHPEHDLFPLLVIECKAIKLNDKVLQQVGGYNHFIHAPFVAVANAEEVYTGWRDGESRDYRFVKFLPTYQDLLGRCCISK